MKNKIAFLGAGNMAHALINGLLADGFSATNILASDPDSEKLNYLSSTKGINACPTNKEAVAQAGVVVLAVKPQILKSLCEDIREEVINKCPLIISIAAGIPCIALKDWLDEETPIVRTMPNTPASINCGATGLYATPNVSQEQKNTSESLMRAVGLTAWVTKEAHLDIVTALSGSGPAYYFLMMEAMENAASKLGLPQETAHILCLQTAFGAAKMALESDDNPALLRQRVTSPGGTTEKAIDTFKQGHFLELVDSAISAANKRSQELAQQFGGKNNG